MTAKEKADKYFSEFIRLRDADQNGFVKCVTCDTYVHWRNMDCGHFMSRRHEATRYEEINAGPQSPVCNRVKDGKSKEFAEHIDKKHGPGTADKLRVKARSLKKRTKADYLYIAEYYRNQVRYLKKEKGL